VCLGQLQLRSCPSGVTPPSSWLCVQGAVAAGMKVVVVPSMVGSQDEEFTVTVQEDGSNGNSSAGGEGQQC
jgi:hypothetical protein